MLLQNIPIEKIDENWLRYKNLLLSTNREGVVELLDYIESTDFKIAPASTKYHGAFKGGLCEHSLKVYELLQKLYEVYLNSCNSKEIGSDSLILVALLHDISKINSYEETVFNKKEYSSSGSKFDELGNYDWVSTKGYKLKDADQRFIFVNHETTSEFIARQFIDLKIEESIAIMTHHNGMGHDSIPLEATGPILSENPLALLLHEADLMAAYTWA